MSYGNVVELSSLSFSQRSGCVPLSKVYSAKLTDFAPQSGIVFCAYMVFRYSMHTTRKNIAPHPIHLSNF